MRENYAECYRLVRQHEGGYVNHPRDPGGATKWGVIQRNYDAYRRRKGQRRRDVKLIIEDEAAEIFKTQYWDKVSGDDLPMGIDYAVFDFAVNSGVSRSAKYFQRVLGVSADGVIGNETLDAVGRLGRVLEESIVRRLCEDRMAFLRRLRHWSTFGKGWSRRVMGNQPGFQERDNGVIDVGIMMSRRQSTAKVKHTEVEGKGRGPKSVLGMLADLIAGLFGGGDIARESK